jgi:ABC-type enterochelin transport system permease subunit
MKRGTRAVARELILELVILVIAVPALVTSIGWPDRAALFPKFISIAIIALVLTRVGLVVVMSMLERNDAPLELKKSGGLDVGLDLHGHGRDLVMLIAILAGFGGAMVGLGFVVGTALAAVAYIRFVARDTWLTAALTAGSLAGVIWLLMTLFHLDFRIGLLI